jgi:site-specific DNA recombinase
VISALADQLLTPNRLAVLLRAAISHRRAADSHKTDRRKELRKDLKVIQEQIGRLLEAIADGTIGERSFVRDKLAGLDIRREECVALLSALDRQLPEMRQALSNQQAKSIAADLKRRLLEAPRALQKRYVHGLVSEIVVNRETAVISGPKAAVAAAISVPERVHEVRSSVREWRSAQSCGHVAPATTETAEPILEN